MRPRGRGDDVDEEDEYEDITPPRRSPGPEAAPAPSPSPPPSPSPTPAPAPAPPQPARAPLSSLVVRPPPQENGDGSSPASLFARSPSPSAGGHRGRGSSPPRRRRDFSPPPPRGWERHRSPPPPLPERRRPGSPPPLRRRFTPPPRFQTLRHPRFHDEQRGYGIHADPSPPRPRRAETSKFDDDGGPRYTHGYQGGDRGGARFQKGSPYGRGGRSYGRGYGAPHGKDLINIDGQYVHRNDPNLSPREGDWICQNPDCGNLNFARRTHCNNCNKFRYSAREAYEPRRSPPYRGYPSPPRGLPRMVGPHGDRAPAREMTRYRSPPHGWVASDPRAYAARSPPERAGRFTDPSPKERMDFRSERDPRDRVKFEWSGDDYIQRERPHDGYLDRSRRHSGSPRGNWGNDLRDRSRSPRNRPMKSSFTGRGRPDDYAADPYASRGRSNGMEASRGRGRGRGRGHVYRPGSGPYPGEVRGERRVAPRARDEDGY